MKAELSRLVKHLDSRTIDREVEEELRFHIEMVRREQLQKGLSPTEATARTLKRFGDLKKVKNQCVQIRKRSRPFQRFLKASLILIALIGLIIIVSTDGRVSRIGNILIMVAALVRLLLYVRNLIPQSQRSTLSLFRDNSQSPLSR
jgi:hypothetical protein